MALSDISRRRSNSVALKAKRTSASGLQNGFMSPPSDPCARDMNHFRVMLTLKLSMLATAGGGLKARGLENSGAPPSPSKIDRAEDFREDGERGQMVILYAE